MAPWPASPPAPLPYSPLIDAAVLDAGSNAVGVASVEGRSEPKKVGTFGGNTEAGSYARFQYEAVEIVSTPALDTRAGIMSA